MSEKMGTLLAFCYDAQRDKIFIKLTTLIVR